MLRCAVAVSFWLVLGATAGDAADAPTGAKEGAAGPPARAKNFSVAHPAIAMIWIAPGTFRMSDPLGAGDDTVVTLTRGYWLGRTEVTQAQWQAIIETAPMSPQLVIAVPSFHKGSDLPVERVSWQMAMAFCARLTELERAAGRLPDGYEYTLPTEAQWEYACRAGTTGRYAGEADAMGWHNANSGGKTHPVAQKRPNAWGLHDMHGNVMEMCADWYAGYPGGKVDDPAGPTSGVYRVLRGGSWQHPPGAMRSGVRNRLASDHLTNVIVGFRVALAPQREVGAGTAASAR